MAAVLVAPLLRNGHLLVLSVALILSAGLAAWFNLPRIEDPRITTRNATIITLLPGADASRVEALVTRKLEEALREVAEVKTLESTSRAGISLIAIELDDRVTAANNARIFSRIRDKLADAERELPPGTSKPNLDDQPFRSEPLHPGPAGRTGRQPGRRRGHRAAGGLGHDGLARGAGRRRRATPLRRRDAVRSGRGRPATPSDEHFRHDHRHRPAD